MGFEFGLLIDTVFLENYLLVVFGLVLGWVDYVVVLFAEPIEGLIHFGCQSVVSANSICYFFVLFGTFLVQNDENQVEPGKQRVWHSDVFGGGELSLILSVDRVGSCDN